MVSLREMPAVTSEMLLPKQEASGKQLEVWPGFWVFWGLLGLENLLDDLLRVSLSKTQLGRLHGTNI